MQLEGIIQRKVSWENKPANEKKKLIRGRKKQTK